MGRWSRTASTDKAAGTRRRCRSSTLKPSSVAGRAQSERIQEADLTAAPASTNTAVRTRRRFRSSSRAPNGVAGRAHCERFHDAFSTAGPVFSPKGPLHLSATPRADCSCASPANGRGHGRREEGVSRSRTGPRASRMHASSATRLRGDGVRGGGGRRVVQRGDVRSPQQAAFESDRSTTTSIEPSAKTAESAPWAVSDPNGTFSALEGTHGEQHEWKKNKSIAHASVEGRSVSDARTTLTRRVRQVHAKRRTARHLPRFQPPIQPRRRSLRASRRTSPG